ncbi:MAG: hypothetical protein ACRDJV_05155 [Actinomycetota bacterium]
MKLGALGAMRPDVDGRRHPSKGPSEEVDEGRWREASFRVLSYYFELRWNHEAMGRQAHRVLRRFEVADDYGEALNAPIPGFPRRYSLVHREDEKPTYALLLGDKELTASELAGVVLEHLFWHVNTQALRTTGDFFLIHSGAVTTPAGAGLLLPGSPGAGKTTLVTALVQAGFGYLSDEAAAIDPVSRLVYAYPRPLALKSPPDRLFPELRSLSTQPDLAWGTWHLDPDDIRPGCVSGPAEIRFVVLPRYEQGQPTEITPVGAAEIAVELGRNSLGLARYRGRALPLLADVARSAAAHRLVFGRLDEAVAAIADLTAV